MQIRCGTDDGGKTQGPRRRCVSWADVLPGQVNEAVRAAGGGTEVKLRGTVRVSVEPAQSQPRRKGYIVLGGR